MKRRPTKYEQRIAQGVAIIDHLESVLLSRYPIVPACIARYKFGDLSNASLNEIRNLGLGRIADPKAEDLDLVMHLVMLAYHITSTARSSLTMLAVQYAESEKSKKQDKHLLAHVIMTIGFAASLVNLGDSVFLIEDNEPEKTQAQINKDLN